LYLARLFNKDLCLPTYLRPLLALPPPRSRLISGAEQLALLRYSRIISVGDRVTRDLISAGVYPWISIFDCVERRGRTKCPALGGYMELVVNNPRSTISHEAINVLESVVGSEERVAIRVIGEEDLLALVSILVAPIGVHVVYGLPGRAAVDVHVDEYHKRSVLYLLSLFKPCSRDSER